MILTESLTINNKQFTKTYSSSGFMIERDGVQYSEAIDPSEFGRTYTETDIPIDIDPTPEPETDIPVEAEPQDETEQKAEAYDYLTGRSNDNE